MSEHRSDQGSAAAPPTEQLVHTLCQEANSLVNRLAGPVKRVSIQAGECRVEVEWEAGGPGAVGETYRERPTPAAAAGTDEVPANQHVVRAPLVGTFYSAPEPGARAFVEVGDVVEADQPVAIVEAMKLMNHVAAGVAGTVTEVLVQDGQWVEFDQPLMYIEPSGG